MDKSDPQYLDFMLPPTPATPVDSANATLAEFEKLAMAWHSVKMDLARLESQVDAQARYCFENGQYGPGKDLLERARALRKQENAAREVLDRFIQDQAAKADVKNQGI